VEERHGEKGGEHPEKAFEGDGGLPGSAKAGIKGTYEGLDLIP